MKKLFDASSKNDITKYIIYSDLDYAILINLQEHIENILDLSCKLSGDSKTIKHSANTSIIEYSFFKSLYYLVYKYKVLEAFEKLERQKKRRRYNNENLLNFIP